MPFAIKSSACDLFIFLYSAIPTGALPMRGHGGWGGARVGAGGLEGDVGRSDLCSGGGGWSELSSGAAVGLGLGRVVVCSAFSSGSALLGPMRLLFGIDSEGRGDSARVCFGMSKMGRQGGSVGGGVEESLSTSESSFQKITVVGFSVLNTFATTACTVFRKFWYT